MPAEKVLLSEAIVIKLSPSGERYTQVSLLSPEHGLFSVLKRNSSKTRAFAIDLFDSGEAHVDRQASDHANRGFLTAFNANKKREGLGASYGRLQAASWISALLLGNPVQEETAADLYRLAERALDALNDGHPPHAVLLKTLFVFARDEGYPVIEDWARHLSPQLAQAVAAVLNTPLADIRIDSESQQNAFTSLSEYATRHTHLYLP